MLIVVKDIINYWAFVVFFLGILGLCILMLVCGLILGGGYTQTKSKNIPFESGINALGTARSCISIKFYLVAIFFVIFDVESLYLYAWVMAIRELGWIGFIEAAVFVFTLLITLFYLVRVGALDWLPKKL